MKTKLRRLEEENNRKDKQIEQLLDPSRVTVSLGQGVKIDKTALISVTLISYLPLTSSETLLEPFGAGSYIIGQLPETFHSVLDTSSPL